MSPEKESLLTRLRKEGPKELVLEILRYGWTSVIGPVIAPMWFGAIAVGTAVWLWLSGLDPLAKWTLALLAIGAALWIANQVRNMALGTSKSSQTAQDQRAPEDIAAVDFWLPGKWEKFFRFKNMGDDQKHRAILAEEVHLRVVARRRMEDVRFQITARQRRGDQLDILTQVGSSKFVGVVPKGLDQDFLIMRRTFSMLSVTHEVLDMENAVTSGQIRAERDVIFFPENSNAFPGRVGETYNFEIAVHHDDGPPDKASFNISLDEVRVPPVSKLWGRVNIEPLAT